MANLGSSTPQLPRASRGSRGTSFPSIASERSDAQKRFCRPQPPIPRKTLRQNVEDWRWLGSKTLESEHHEASIIGMFFLETLHPKLLIYLLSLETSGFNCIFPSFFLTVNQSNESKMVIWCDLRRKQVCRVSGPSPRAQLPEPEIIVAMVATSNSYYQCGRIYCLTILELCIYIYTCVLQHTLSVYFCMHKCLWFTYIYIHIHMQTIYS